MLYVGNGVQRKSNIKTRVDRQNHQLSLLFSQPSDAVTRLEWRCVVMSISLTSAFAVAFVRSVVHLHMAMKFICRWRLLLHSVRRSLQQVHLMSACVVDVCGGTLVKHLRSFLISMRCWTSVIHSFTSVAVVDINVFYYHWGCCCCRQHSS